MRVCAGFDSLRPENYDDGKHAYRAHVFMRHTHTWRLHHLKDYNLPMCVRANQTMKRSQPHVHVQRNPITQWPHAKWYNFRFCIFCAAKLLRFLRWFSFWMELWCEARSNSFTPSNWPPMDWYTRARIPPKVQYLPLKRSQPKLWCEKCDTVNQAPRAHAPFTQKRTLTMHMIDGDRLALQFQIFRHQL